MGLRDADGGYGAGDEQADLGPELSAPLIEIAAGSDNFWLVGSTLLGAAVGGLASGIASWFVAVDAEKRGEKAKTRATALQLVVKAKLLADSAYSTQSQIERTIAEAEAAGVSGPTWAKLSGIMGLDTPPVFLEPEEISLLIRMKDDDLTNEYILITHRLRSVEVALGEYEKRRTKLTEAFGGASMNGRVGSSLFTPKEMAALAPRMVDVGIFADDLRKRANEEHLATMRLVHRLGPRILAFLKDPAFPVGAIPEEFKHLVESEDERP